MIPTLTTLLKTVTGKAVIGLTVATMSVGAAAAAGAELPVLSNPQAPTLERIGDGSSSESTDDESTDDESTDDESTEEATEESTDEQSEAQESDESDESDDDSKAAGAVAADASGEASDDDESNHGAVVSEFTRMTELTGCEKGQATAAVARGDVDPTTAVDIEADLAPFIAKCSKHDDDENADGGSTDDDWKGVRDETKAAWHDAKDAYLAACGDDDDDQAGDDQAGDDQDGDDQAGDELSPECRLMKAELKELHQAGKAEWKAVRDEAHAERKAERAEARAEKSDRSGKGGSKASGGKKNKDG